MCFWASRMDLDPYCYNSVYAFSYELDQQYRSLLHFFYTFVKDIDNFHQYNLCWKLLVKYRHVETFRGESMRHFLMLCNWTGRNALTSKREETQSSSQEEEDRGDTVRFTGEGGQGRHSQLGRASWRATA